MNPGELISTGWLYRRFIPAWMIVLAGACCIPEGLGQPPQKAGMELTPLQLFVPAPRDLVRPMMRAEKAMQQQDYGQAVELLGDILASERHDDYLQPVPGNPFRSVSIHDQAHRLLGQIPREYRADYELRYAVTARQWLERAVRESDFPLLARISRNYFYTEPGYQATLLLGHHYLEMGQPVSAASCFSMLKQDAYARDLYEPEVSVMLATCWLLTGSQAEAQATLEELAALQPQARVRLADREVPLFSQPGDALDWLVNLVGSTTLAGYKSVDDWLMFRGNPQRNASSGTGFPLPYARWYVPTVNDPQHERLAEKQFQSRLSSGESLIPALQPIAVGDTVVVRSLDQMIGIDMPTGKRIWEFPARLRDSQIDEDQQSMKIRQDRTEAWHVDQRLWRDRLFGQIASNGRLVFVIDQPGFAAPANQRSVVNRGLVIRNPVGGRDSNELKAVDLVRQGAFCWEVGGESGGKVPELAGCFFLGAPLVLENELYILGELGGAIRLFVLSQESGELLWSQSVAAIESTNPVTQDRLRRLAGATPSCSNNIIVCPTSATGIVAVDRTTRSLMWGAQYPGGGAGETSARSRSLDASITIAEGKVVVLPVESQRVLCYDLLTGQPCWPPPEDTSPDGVFGRPNEDAQFIACVVDSQVILVGSQELRSLDLNNGDTRWRISLEPFGRPSGQGFLSDRFYYLPTSDRKILQLNLTEGAIGEVVETRRVLGNLVCYRNELISQGYDTISIYPQAAPIRQQVLQGLANHPGGKLSAELLSWNAQLQAQSGDLVAAVETAEKAFQLTGQRRDQRLLMDLILGLMQSNYTAVGTLANKYAAELREYGGFQYEAALFGGLLERGAVSEALTVLRESGYGQRESAQPLENSRGQYRRMENGVLRLRLDAWLSHRLVQALQGEINQAGFEELRRWCAAAAEEMPLSQLDAFVELVGSTHFPESSLFQLTEWQLNQKQFTRAEQTLHALASHNGTLKGNAPPSTEARIAGLRIRIADEVGWQDRAELRAREMIEKWPEVSFPDPWNGQPLTGRQLALRILKTMESETAGFMAGWNYGRIDGRLQPSQTDRRFLMRTTAYPQLVSLSDDAIDDVRLEIIMQDARLVVRDGSGNRIGQVAYLENPDSRRFFSPRLYSGSYALHGNLLVFAHGYELIAVDLNLMKLGRRALLWQKKLQQESAVTNQIQFRPSYQAKPISNPWSQIRYRVHSQGDPNPVGNFASNARHVFCRVGQTIQCLDSRTGQLVWQRTDLDQAGWLVADEDRVALLRQGKDSPTAKYHSATVMDAATGLSMKTVDLADYKQNVLWHHQGLQLLWSGQDQNSLVLFDLNQEQEVWSRNWPDKTHAVLRDPGEMVFVTPNGRLEYVDLANGSTTLKSRLQPLAFRTCKVMKFRDCDLLLLNRGDAHTRDKPHDVDIRAAVNGSNDLFNGWVYCLDRTSGEMAWKHPARVEHFSLPMEHPINTPLITFNRMMYPGSDANRGRENLIEFYSLDLRDGRLVDVQRIKNWTLRSMEITVDRDLQTVSHQFNDHSLKLQLRAGELPPSAPASLTSEFSIPRARQFVVGDQQQRLSNRQQQLIRQARERSQDE